jgi:magnesium transporter
MLTAMNMDFRLRRLRARQASRRRRTPVGAAPGTLITDPAAAKTTIRVIGYGLDSLDERDCQTAAAVAESIGKYDVLWVDVTGLADSALLLDLGGIFGIHPLALEDVIDVHQRPKVEDYQEHIFIVTRMFAGPEDTDSEQISLFVGKGFVVTFQERPGDTFEAVRARLRQGRKQIRGEGADYLAYALIDAVIDGYFPVLEHYGERLEALQDRVLAEPHTDLAAEIHDMKRDLLTVRRAVWPQREMINALIRGEDHPFTQRTRIYLRDCYDHCIQLMDMVETYREIASGLIDVYLSSMSTRMNEIMKVLTIIATIFIPLSFVAAVYGMNFNPAISPWNMPELNWRWGYPAVLVLMITMAVGLLWFFWRRGWIGRGGRRRPKQDDGARRP